MPLPRVMAMATALLMPYKTMSFLFLLFRNIGGTWVPHTNQLPVVINTLAWPVSANGYHLQFTDALSPRSHWTTLPNPSIEINNRHIVTNTVGNQAARFYRLGP
jgi:hypothetical protein